MRVPIAMLIMFAVIIAYVFIVASIGSELTEIPRLLQLAFYAIAGVAWVFPLKPVINWMNRRPGSDSSAD